MQPYKIYIMQYARRDTNTSEVFLGDFHQSPLEMAYYMWLITNGEHTVVVDMGFTEAVGTARRRSWVGSPGDRMEALGFDPAQVEHVIITHMHYDHVGNYAMFPKARFYLQESELTFWTGRHARFPVFNHSVEVEDVVELVRCNFAGRIRFVEGTQQILPGITLHKVGGHTAGMQIVEVQTASGVAVVASDAAHYYRNFQEDTPFQIIHSIPDFLDGFERLRSLASRPELIVPGHDPLVMKNFPLVSEYIALLE